MSTSGAASSGGEALDGQETNRSTTGGDMCYADIGVNLTDAMFQGTYHGKTAHESDLQDVIQRAVDVGCTKLMITGSDLAASKEAVELARRYPANCLATVGIHPCSSTIFETHPGGTDAVLKELGELVRSAMEPTSNTDSTDSADTKSSLDAPTSVSAPSDTHQHIPLAAIGEFGLDYDRLPLSPKHTQLHAFRSQLDYLTSTLFPDSATHPAPPLFLHSRAAHADFVACLRPHLAKLPRRGVVHSFTGTVDEMRELLDAGFDIGMNGCSVRSEEGLEVIKELPLERLHLETDAPWCEIRPSSAGAKHLGEGERAAQAKTVKKEKWVKGAMVKGRNESCRIGEVARVVAGVKGVGIEEVAGHAWRNWERMFGSHTSMSS